MYFYVFWMNVSTVLLAVFCGEYQLYVFMTFSFFLQLRMLNWIESKVVLQQNSHFWMAFLEDFEQQNKGQSYGHPKVSILL